MAVSVSCWIISNGRPGECNGLRSRSGRKLSPTVPKLSLPGPHCSYFYALLVDFAITPTDWKRRITKENGDLRLDREGT